MKKLIPVLTLFFGCIPFLAVSQSVGMGPYVGLAGAINNTWIVLDNELQNNEHHEHQPTFGPAGGLVLGYKFNDKNSIQLEGLVSKQGGKYDLKDDAGSVIGDKEIDLTYFAIPLLFKLSGTGTTRFNFHIGGQVAFLMKGEEVNTFTTGATVTNPNMPGGKTTVTPGTYVLATKDNDNFNTVDPSGLLGFGVEHDLSDQLYLSANIRLNYGFKNILKEETVARPNDLDTYTLRYNVLGGFQVGLHYFFQEQ